MEQHTAGAFRRPRAGQILGVARRRDRVFEMCVFRHRKTHTSMQCSTSLSFETIYKSMSSRAERRITQSRRLSDCVLLWHHGPAKQYQIASLTLHLTSIADYWSEHSEQNLPSLYDAPCSTIIYVTNQSPGGGTANGGWRQYMW
jgi:hypothetical protein